MDNLLVSVFGHQQSGKSTTWNTLFGATQKTGTYIRKLYLNDTEYVEVFLVSGSPQERNIPVEEILGGLIPRIVLCSIQYHQTALSTYQYFTANNYQLYCQWLNPGFNDANTMT